MAANFTLLNAKIDELDGKVDLLIAKQPPDVQPVIDAVTDRLTTLAVKVDAAVNA